MKNKIALEMILKAIRYLVVNPSYFKINIAIFISSSKKNRGFSKIEKINKAGIFHLDIAGFIVYMLNLIYIIANNIICPVRIRRNIDNG